MEKFGIQTLVALGLSLFSAMPIEAWAVKFSWNLPTTREDGSSLITSDIAEAELLISSTAGSYGGAQSFKSTGAATSLDIGTLAVGTYFAVVRVSDTGGRKSGFSNEVQFAVAPPATPTPTPTITPTPTPTPPSNSTPTPTPSVKPTASPSASPSASASPSGKFAAKDFDGNGISDFFKGKRNKFTIKLSTTAGEGLGQSFTGKLLTQVADAMIGYGRYNGAKSDSVVYVRLPLSKNGLANFSTKGLLEWVSVDHLTGSESTLFKFGKFGDTPIFGCYDENKQSAVLVLRTLANGKKAVFAKVDNKSKKTILPEGATGAICKLAADGTSTVEPVLPKAKANSAKPLPLKF